MHKFNVGDIVIVTDARKVGLPDNYTSSIDGKAARVCSKNYAECRGGAYYMVLPEDQDPEDGKWWVYERQCELKYDLSVPVTGDISILGI